MKVEHRGKTATPILCPSKCSLLDGGAKRENGEADLQRREGVGLNVTCTG
jgi:hypothetical protein